MKNNVLTISLMISGLWVSSTASSAEEFNSSHRPSANNPFKLTPLTDADFHTHSPEKIELGRNLFFDKVLSGNRNISCATCHHTLTDTTDGLSLPIGEGASGLGVNRDTGEEADAVHQRVPHNSPALFNLGALEFTVLFNDGRIFADSSQPSGFTSPAGNNLPDNLESTLAAQAMFPVTNPTEMAGQAGENLVANAASIDDLAGPDGVWELLSKRLRGIAKYVEMFEAAYADVNGPEDITFVHAANAIAAFAGTAWRADNSPFDRYLRGERQAMSPLAQEGMRLFYNGNRRTKNSKTCASCHSGTLQTDHDFHAIAMPQIGPGKGDGFEGLEDFGHGRLNDADRYKFRTPSLRNVALTAPYGHSGVYNKLRAVVEHHVNAINSLYNYDRSQAVLPSRPDLDALDFRVMDEPAVLDEIANASEIRHLNYSHQDIDRIMEFLHALTDPASLDLRSHTPKHLPSDLPLAD